MPDVNLNYESYESLQRDVLKTANILQNSNNKFVNIEAGHLGEALVAAATEAATQKKTLQNDISLYLSMVLDIAKGVSPAVVKDLRTPDIKLSEFIDIVGHLASELEQTRYELEQVSAELAQANDIIENQQTGLKELRSHTLSKDKIMEYTEYNIDFNLAAEKLDFSPVEEGKIPRYAYNVAENNDGSVVAFMDDRTLRICTIDGERVKLPENCNQLFDARGFSVVDLSNCDAQYVTEMNEMFSYCESLAAINMCSNTHNLKSTMSMFCDCSSLNSVYLGNMDLSKLTEADNMFAYCDNLESVVFNSTHMSEDVEMLNIFKECPSLDFVEIKGYNKEATDAIKEQLPDNVKVISSFKSIPATKESVLSQAKEASKEQDSNHGTLDQETKNSPKGDR